VYSGNGMIFDFLAGGDSMVSASRLVSILVSGLASTVISALISAMIFFQDL